MKKRKVAPGQYFVCHDSKMFEVFKDEKPGYLSYWALYRGVDRKDFLIKKKTLKECLEFIEHGYTPKNMVKIEQIPKQQIDKKYRSKRTGNIWSIDDIIYSTADGKWKIEASWYNDSIDSGNNTFNTDEFEIIFEEIEE